MTSASIPFVNLSAQWKDEREELLPIIEMVMSTGQYIGGEVIERFESKVANLCKTRFCVALNSGTDALVCGMMALGISAGDEVLTPPNSFIASTASIVHLKARPIFIDVLPDQNIDPEKIEQAITKKTKCIMPVHLTGRMAAMEKILEIAENYGIHVVEDAAQSLGSLYSNLPSGSFGKVGCFSAHPLKNLNACGDAGFVTTNDPVIAERIKLARNHGLVDRNTVERFGYVSRMDVLQATILEYRLTKLPDVIKKRRRNASLYFRLLNPEHIFIPKDSEKEFNTFHTFVIQCDKRDKLKNFLMEKGIETAIHYPIPIHLQPATASLGYGNNSFPVSEDQSNRILSLPIHQYLEEEHISKISKTINSFFIRYANRN